MALCKLVHANKFDSKYEIHGFLYTASRNLWINKCKRERIVLRMKDEPEQLEEFDFDLNIMTPQKEQGIKQLLSLLGKRCTDLLQKSILFKTPSRQLCEELGYANENALKTQKYKCKKKLFKVIDDHPNFKELLDE